MLDTASCTKFLKVLAGNENVMVHYKPGLKVPYATVHGEIYVAPPTITDLLEWNFHVHHELSHCFRAHKYHYDAMSRSKVEYGELGGLILNLLVDNIAEQYEYTRYEGRRMILSKGRLETIKKMTEKLFPDVPTMGIIHGLMAWDCSHRTSWMGYPFETFLSPVDKYPEVVEYLEKINLTDLMASQTTADDLVAIVGKILEFEQSDDSGEGDDDGNDDGDNASDPNGDSGDPDNGSDEGDQPAGSSDDNEPGTGKDKGEVDDESNGKSVPDNADPAEESQ
jgi:hypothetical protein